MLMSGDHTVLIKVIKSCKKMKDNEAYKVLSMARVVIQ